MSPSVGTLVGTSFSSEEAGASPDGTTVGWKVGTGSEKDADPYWLVEMGRKLREEARVMGRLEISSGLRRWVPVTKITVGQ